MPKMAIEDYFQGGCAPVLIVDDEEGDVADLIRVFGKYYAKLHSQMEIPSLLLRGFYDFISSPEEAVLLMKEQQEKGCKYRAIVTDFHMAPIDGKDFLRVVFDRFAYALTRDSSFKDIGLEDLEIKDFEDLESGFHVANRDVLDFLTGNFEDLNYYRTFLRYWNNPDFEIAKIIFAGAERGDYTDDKELEMAYFRKPDNSEEAIVDFLCSSGVLPPDIYGTFFDYKRFDPNVAKEEKKFTPGKKIKKWRTSDL